MDWINALIMGIVQGLAEYLPISSSGHLEICRELLGLDLTGAESLEFDVMLHVATVLSTIVVLWREFVPLCTSFFTFKRDNNFYYVVKILVSCVPVAVVGLFFKETIESFFGGGLGIVGICLCVTAALLTFSYFFRTRKAIDHPDVKAYKGRDISMFDAFIIGCSQAVAVLPGLSRSGTTIATGILLGDRREQVAQFSFFMVIIPILGEALLDVKKILEGSAAAGASIGWVPMLVGFLASFVVGCIACKWMLEIVKRGKLVWFAVYCLIVGVICIVTSF
ncbi:MAG: undecaprenyl-diphosphate phosphatase [Muribaculaceae bacterium]|nr:undecaprenyl-diphosphate phosphatase [Muribaculaceae bacterium]